MYSQLNVNGDGNQDITAAADRTFSEFEEIYSRFSSFIMASQLAKRRNLGLTELEPYCETVFAAVLFADISGFTRLSARLSEEELKFHINEYFSALLGVVEENHGDIVKFCGDAVMIMWSVDRSADEDVKAAAVLMACVCALQLVGDCGRYDRGEGTQVVSLRLHCGIGCGEVHCMCVGEQSRWEYLISGDAIHQVGIAEPEAGVGQTCLSPEAHAFVRHRLETKLMPQGSYLLTGGTRRPKFCAASTDIGENTSAMLTHGASTSIDEYGISIVNEYDPNVSDLSAACTNESTSNKERPPTTEIDGRPAFISHAWSINKMTSSTMTSTKGSSPAIFNSKDASPSISSSPAPRQKNVTGCFSCFYPEVVRPSNIDLPPSFFPYKHSPMAIRESRNTVLTPQSADSRRRSFIVDIGTRMRTMGKYTHSNSVSNMPVYSDDSADIDAIKSTLCLHTDLAVRKARAYLHELPGAAATNNPVPMSLFLRPFIHNAALEAIESNLFEFGYLAEKRMVATMFIEILGLDDDFRNGDVKRPQQVMVFVLACLNRFEGSLRQFVVDDKGCICICAFGLPGTHHEDNCTRAVETAKAISKSLQTLQIGCRTGIAAGPTYCGLVGSRSRFEYALMGSSVNLAARLMSTCNPGSIVTNEVVYQDACEDFEFSILSPIMAKGYDNKVNVYCPLNRVHSLTSGLGSKLNQHCQFVGKRVELLQFTNILADFGVGENDLERSAGYIIQGSAGIGKTNLVSEINEIAKKDSNISTVAYASASASHMSSSYFVIRQILDFVLSLDRIKVHGRSPVITSRALSRPAMMFIRSESRKSDGDSEKSCTPPVSMSRLLSTNNGEIDMYRSCREISEFSSLASPTYPRNVFRKLPSLKIERKFQTFAVEERESIFANAIHTVEAWVDSFRCDIMVTALDTIGSSSKYRAQPKNSSFDAIFTTSTTTVSSTSNVSRGESDIEAYSPHNLHQPERLSYSMKSLLPLLGDILSIPCEESLVTLSLTPEMRWRMCDALIVQILKLVMDEDKIVFVVENLQWCDSQSLCVLFYFLRDTLGGLFIGTERPPEGNAHDSSSHQHGSIRLMKFLRKTCHIIDLQPMRDIDIYNVMEQVVGADYLDSYPLLKTEETIAALVERTAGLPFAVIALCLALKTALVNSTFVDISRLSSGVHNVIVNRFDQLSTVQKVVLKVASVIGRVFSVELLRQALIELNCSNCASSLHHTLEALANVKLIKLRISNSDVPVEWSEISPELHAVPHIETDKKAANTYEFVDQSVQYGIYNLMLAGQCKLVHGVVGNLLEASNIDNIIFEEVVYHFNLSSDLEKKLRYLRLAAKEAESLKDYKKCIYYNAELIKFATNMSLEMLIEWCFGKGEARKIGHNSADLTRDISMHPQDNKGIGGDLRVVRNIFAGRSRTGGTGVVELISPQDSWLALNKDSNQIIVSDAAAELGATKTDVCRWLAVVADAERRIGLYHWGNNFCIVALLSMNCSLLVDESCPGLWKRRLKLKKYPRFWQKKTFKVAIACYENLAMFQLIRGFSDVALSVLKMMQKVIEQNDPTWVAELSNEIRRQNGLFSLAYLGCGDASKAALHLMKAISSADGDIDAYTCACIQYVQSFHSASNGLFSAAFDQCMDSANSLCQVKELGMQHLVYLSAGWYAFLLGDVNRSTELYHTVFEYGLSTADRPLIKMSLELYAAILIMNEDFPNANLVLDNLKSPLQTSATSDGWIRPSSIKSSLIAISCALEKRFSYAIPHIQFACNVLSEINPSNPVCGIYLFFSAFSAIEVLLNIDLLPLELRKSTASALMPAASRSVHALERCMCSAPTLKLMHLACLMKLQRLEVSPNISVLSEGIKLSKSLDSDDRYSSGVHLNVDIKLKDSESNFNSSRREKCALLLKYQDKWVNIGNVGVHDEFTLGKLFYHKERMALCQQLNLTDEFIKSTFDSGFFYKQLIKLYSRDTSLRALSEKLDSARSILNIDSARRDISRLNQSTECVSGIRSNSLYDMELSPDVQDKYVTEQLVKLHLYEQLRQKSDAEERKHEMHAGLKQNTNLSGPSLRLGDNKSTKMTSNRFSPITRRPKVSPEWVSDDSPLMSISPTKIPAFASARRGSV